MEGQFLLLVLTVSLCEWQVLALEPHDQCRNNFRYAPDHIYPDNWHLLMDSYDYENLLQGSNPVWKRSDEDGDGRGWTHGIGGVCQRSIAALDTFESPNQNNWVFTHYIDYDEAIEVIVNVTFRFSSCANNPSCDNDFVTLYRYDTNTPNENQQTDDRNYISLLRSEEESRLRQGSQTGDVEIELTYTRPPNINGFYLALRDTGTDGFIRRIYVYYKIVPSYTDGLKICPDVPLRSSGTTTRECTCADNAIGTSLTRLCSPNGTCKDNSTCSCVPGYEQMETICQSCLAGMYRSASDQACLQCPANTMTDQVAASQCECSEGYYRVTGEGPAVDCTAPPSAVSNLRTSGITTSSVTLLWHRPISARQDVYYSIFSSVKDDPPKLVTNYTSPSINVEYIVSQLKPTTKYKFVVVAHNGVSDQDTEYKHERRTEILAMTKDGLPSAPKSVQAFCKAILWERPSLPNGEVVGYDVSLFVPGRPSFRRTVQKDDTCGLFRIIEDDSIMNKCEYYVQVRAKTNSSNGGGEGEWSPGVPLGCECNFSVPCDVSDLHTPNHGAVSVLNNKATYSCDDFYLLKGEHTRICSNGIWTGVAPTCEPPECRLELNGKVYGNNSVIQASDIGEGNEALQCVTGYSECCSKHSNRVGEFYYPDGGKVRISAAGHTLYRNRGDQRIFLHRRGGGQVPSGLYCCEIPASDKEMKRLCVTINK